MFPIVAALMMVTAVAVADSAVLELRQAATVAHVIESVAWHPSGSELATAGDAPSTVVWDARNLQPIQQLEEDYKGNPGRHSVAFSSDGRQLASGVKVVYVWDAATWQRKTELVGPAKDRTSVKWRITRATTKGFCYFRDPANLRHRLYFHAASSAQLPRAVILL